MKKYYTRACNFYYGVNAKKLIKKKIALPLCGNQNIAFDKIEIIVRKKNKVISKIISLKKIHTLSTSCKNKVKHDLKNIVMKIIRGYWLIMCRTLIIITDIRNEQNYTLGYENVGKRK